MTWFLLSSGVVTSDRDSAGAPAASGKDKIVNVEDSSAVDAAMKRSVCAPVALS